LDPYLVLKKQKSPLLACLIVARGASLGRSFEVHAELSFGREARLIELL
jgi:hypothetical protein